MLHRVNKGQRLLVADASRIFHSSTQNKYTTTDSCEAACYLAGSDGLVNNIVDQLLLSAASDLQI